MSKSVTFDIAVVGAGPGGYVAAIRAAQLGLKTALVEREHLGGVCLNWGCIPTKALLHSADLYRSMRDAAACGIGVSGLTFDLEAMVQRSRAVAKQLTSGIKGLLKKSDLIYVFNGCGKLVGTGEVSVAANDGTKTTVHADHVVLATGARARDLPGMEADGNVIWNYKHALRPKAIPKSLLVVGAGAIGVEFASFFNTFGSEVTLVEGSDRIVPAEDTEISTALETSFKRQGINVMTRTSVSSMRKSATGATVIVATNGGEKSLTVERVLMAVGVTPNVEDLGLEGTSIQRLKGHLVTDRWCATHERGVYAIGDLVQGPWLAHKASHEAVICIEKIAGLEGVHPLDTLMIPGCTYCHPQVASIGLSEDKAKEAGHNVKVGRFPFIANGKASAIGETEGFIKSIFDGASGELLGAHMIGGHVTEMIHGFGVAKSLEATEADLMGVVFPHPTLSEMIHESTLAAYGRAIHF